jgi:hypothetical protein
MFIDVLEFVGIIGDMLVSAKLYVNLMLLRLEITLSASKFLSNFNTPYIEPSNSLVMIKHIISLKAFFFES